MISDYDLSIKTPCREDFNKFSPTPNGGFCNSCKKEVVDFTEMDAKQISSYFKTHFSENTCGRFKTQQLFTETIPIKKRNFLSLFSGVGLACLSIFSFGSLKAQSVKKQTIKKDTSNRQEIKNSITVKGTVTDSGIAMPGVNVVLQGAAVGTQTNFDGFFKFPQKLKKGDILVFSFVGMTSKKVTIVNEESASDVELKVDLKSCEMILMGRVATKQVYKSKKKN